tara:strand:- start:13833 stop:14120 length:288 start_codon:yes stop_codon:yes gene_type:complete
MAASKVDGSRKRKKTGGRTAGTPNKTTALLKDAILEAATKAGNKAGIVGYLTTQANENPAAFMTLLGKVLPMQVAGTDEDGEPTSIMVHYVSAKG